MEIVLILLALIIVFLFFFIAYLTEKSYIKGLNEGYIDGVNDTKKTIKSTGKNEITNI